MSCNFDPGDQPPLRPPWATGFDPYDQSEWAESVPPLVRAVRQRPDGPSHPSLELVRPPLAHGADPNAEYPDLPQRTTKQEEDTMSLECRRGEVCFTCGRRVQLAMEPGCRDVVEVFLGSGAEIDRR